MAIVNQEVSSIGIGPQRLNVVERFVGYPRVSSTAGILSLTLSAASTNSSTFQTTTTGAGSTNTTNLTLLTWGSFASISTAGTGLGTSQPDYCRNLAYSISNSALSSNMASGTIRVSGFDLAGNSNLVETLAASAVNSSGTFVSGTANFRWIQGATFNQSFPSTLAYTSSQLSDSNGGTSETTSGVTLNPGATLRVGLGEKLALPAYLLSNTSPNNFAGVLAVRYNSVQQLTTATYSSTSNNATSTVTLTSLAPLFTISTGDYRINGVINSAYAVGSLFECDYKLNGFI